MREKRDRCVSHTADYYAACHSTRAKLEQDCWQPYSWAAGSPLFTAAIGPADGWFSVQCPVNGPVKVVYSGLSHCLQRTQRDVKTPCTWFFGRFHSSFLCLGGFHRVGYPCWMQWHDPWANAYPSGPFFLGRGKHQSHLAWAPRLKRAFKLTLFFFYICQVLQIGFIYVS